MVGIREVEGTGFNFFGNCLIWGCFGLWFLLGLAGRGRPAATHFSLLRQRKVSKRKATRSLGPYASLRATCGARLRRGLARTRFAQTIAIPDPPTSALLGPARTGQAGAGTKAGTEDRYQRTNQDKQGLATASPCSFRYWIWYSSSPALVDAPRSAGPD